MAVASLVLGIISLVVGVFVSGFGWIGSILGIVGIILGAVARKNGPEEKAGIAKAGLVCSILGTILGLLLYVACVACVGGLASAMPELGDLTSDLMVN